MAEVTIETFREAANEAVRNLDEGEPNGDRRDELRELINKVLSEGAKNAGSKDTTAEDVAARIQKMIWPERDLEIRRAAKMKEVDREAEKLYIIERVRAILEEQNG